jgi:hypothetical protein
MRVYTTNCTESRLPSFHKQSLYVRYEDLVQHTSETLQLLSEFTGIALASDAAVSNAPAGQIDYDSPAQARRPLHSSLYGKALSPTRIGNYKKVLTSAQIETVEQICAPILHRFGYKSG